MRRLWTNLGGRSIQGMDRAPSLGGHELVIATRWRVNCIWSLQIVKARFPIPLIIIDYLSHTSDYPQTPQNLSVIHQNPHIRMQTTSNKGVNFS